MDGINFFNEDEYKRLRAMSKALNVPIAKIIRDAVKRYVDQWDSTPIGEWPAKDASRV